MAKPVTRGSAVQVVEDAVHLLRQAPLSSIVCHWIGSAPFGLALLLFWNDVTNPRTPDASCVTESFVLALLLTWMNCWRSVYAGRLRRQLGGLPEPPWTWHRLWRLLATQSFLGATKLVVIPVAALVMFPLAWAAAFYRNAVVLADRGDLAPGELIATAWRLAGLNRKQGWALIPVLTFLQVLVFANLALTLAILPQLVRMLTGYESEFSRGGIYFVLNPLFLMATLVLSWMAFDPVVQAAYCVRCFQAESLETGEDLRAGLRTIRQSMRVGAAVLLLSIAGGSSMAAPQAPDLPPAELERSVRQAMQAHEYDWRIPPPPASSTASTPWLVRVTDRLVDGVRSVTSRIGDAIRKFFDWLQEKLGTVPVTPAGTPPAKGLHWGLYVLIAAVIALAAWLAWRALRSRKPKSQAGAGVVAPISLAAEDLTPDLLPEDRWLELAERCLLENNLRFAMRAFFLAGLAWLGRSGYITIHPGKTNHEYELELRRRARTLPAARQHFADSIGAFERVWYGMHEISGEDVRQFRARIQEMKSLLAVPQGAAA